VPSVADLAGFGTVGGVPGPPAAFASGFRSLRVDTGPVALHAVVGGSGPPVVLLCGWPQTWYAWRLLMPALARDFTVVAPDPRGVGRSGVPADGYDTGTLAADVAALMATLHHDRFAVVGHDIGMWTGYALAADHPDRVARLAVAEAVIPGLTPSPPLLGPREAAERLWHFGFNRVDGLAEALVAGREAAFLASQFSAKAATPLAADAVAHYVAAVARGPEALRGSLAPYRALEATMAQNARRGAAPLAVPVLAVGGGRSTGGLVGATMALVALDLRAVVLPGCGHYPAEEDPQGLLAVLGEFLAPWRG
jgi:pimeloyl-ACP methyl ester carboxylesterase